MGSQRRRIVSSTGKHNKFYPDEALRHLSAIFQPCDKCWLEIRIVSNKGAFSKWFRDPGSAVKWLADNWEKMRLWQRHVFYGVLPRVSDGEPRGAGNSSMVREGHVLFADIDYKEPVDKCEGGLEESPDGSISGCVVIEGKSYRVERPPLQTLLDKYKQLFGDEPYLVVDSGYGYHVFARLPEPVPVDDWRRLQDTFIKLLGGDPKSRDPARVLRLAGTINPKSSESPKPVRIVYSSDSVLDPSKLTSANASGESVDAVEIATKLAEYWIPGHRDALTTALIGMMIKAGIPREKAKAIIENITKLARDEEAAKRLYEVERQYRLVEEGRKKKKELCGKKCLVDELEQILAETKGLSGDEARDKAIEIVQELEKVIGPARSILVKAPYSSNAWIVNDPKRGIVLLKITGGENNPKEKRSYISDWYIVKALVVKTENDILYKLKLRNARTRERFIVSGDLQEIARVLKRIHGVKRRVNLEDALSAIVSELIKRGVAKVKRSAPVAGIIPARDGVKLVRTGALSKLLIPKEPDPARAARALELLSRLREYYDPAKYDVAILWAGYAPASYALKKLFHVKQVYLLLHGEKQTGKTTLARIITSMFPVATAEEDEIPEEGQSEYRLAWKLNVAAVPLLEDEIQGISRKPSLLGLLKRAASGDLVRWRGDSGRRYRARAPLVFTSNYTELLDDPALVERIIAIEFTQADYVYSKPINELNEFKRLYNEYRRDAPHLGAYILSTIVEEWEKIVEEYAHRLHEPGDVLVLGKYVWRRVAEKLGRKAPWAESTPPSPETERAETGLVEAFWETIEDAVTRAARAAGIVVSEDLVGAIKSLDAQHLLPSWLKVKGDSLVVLNGILPELEKRTSYVPSLRRLAKILGYPYKAVRLPGRVVKAIHIPFKVLAVNTGEDFYTQARGMLERGAPPAEAIRKLVVLGLDYFTASQVVKKALRDLENNN